MGATSKGIQHSNGSTRQTTGQAGTKPYKAKGRLQHVKLVSETHFLGRSENWNASTNRLGSSPMQ